MFDYVTYAQCMNENQKIVQGRGPSNINLGIFVCFITIPIWLGNYVPIQSRFDTSRSRFETHVVKLIP